MSRSKMRIGILVPQVDLEKDDDSGSGDDSTGGTTSPGGGGDTSLPPCTPPLMPPPPPIASDAVGKDHKFPYKTKKQPWNVWLSFFSRGILLRWIGSNWQGPTNKIGILPGISGSF